MRRMLEVGRDVRWGSLVGRGAVAGIAAASLMLGGCAVRPVVAMHPATSAPLVRPAAPGQATVLFVRPPSSCDTTGYPTIADENGHFIGNAGPNTTFSVRVPAGRHVFYAWPHIDPQADDDLYFTPVGALVVDATAASVSEVGIVVPEAGSLRCLASAGYGLVANDGTGATRAEFEAWRREAIPVEPDVQIGEQDLERNRAHVCGHIAVGRRHVHAPAPTTCGAVGRFALDTLR